MSLLLNFLKIKEYDGKMGVRMLGGIPSPDNPMIKMIDDGICHVYGIDIFGKIVGRVCLSVDEKDKKLADGKTVCYLSNLYVNSRFRGRGIGTKLMNHAIDNAKKMGYRYSTLLVDEGIEKNVNLYKKLGFNNPVRYGTSTVHKDDGTTVVKKYIAMKKDLTEE